MNAAMSTAMCCFLRRFVILVCLAIPLIATAQEPDAIQPASGWSTIQRYFTPPAEFAGQRGDYRSPLLFADGSQVTSPQQWQRRRQELRQQWQRLLGKWPPLLTEPKVTVLDQQTIDEGRIVIQTIRFRWLPDQETTGYLLLPQGQNQSLPAVLTVFYEPETAIGKGKPNRDFAIQLARRGFVTLSIGTTEASERREYGLFYPSIEDAHVQPLSMLAYAAANAWYVLASQQQVDAKRIGIFGHSYGGKWAMFASCLFDRFACAAWSDPGIVFDESRPSVNYWEPWYLGYHPQPWRQRGLISEQNPARGLYPKLREQGRDLHELHALMSPRPFLVSGGSEDPPARWQALNHSLDVNKLLGVQNRVAMSNRPNHSPDDQSNAIIYAFFEHFLSVNQER